MTVPKERPGSSHATKSPEVMSRPMPRPMLCPQPTATDEHEHPDSDSAHASVDESTNGAVRRKRIQRNETARKWRRAFRSLWKGARKR